MHYSATAYDAVDGTISVICSPASGSMFSVGTTTVNCTASDAAGNMASKSFTVTVIAPPVDTDGDGYHDGIDSCPNDASSTNNGCPESPCPTDDTGASEDSDGNCPEATLTDSDGDGVVDSADDCPNELGVNIANGCPFVKGGMLMLFDSNAAILGLFPVEYGGSGTLTLPVQKQDGTTGVIVSGHVITFNHEWGPQDTISLDLIVKYPPTKNVVISTAIPQLDRLRNNVVIEGDYDFIPVDKKYLKLNTIQGFNSSEIIVTNGDLDDAITNQTISSYGSNHKDDNGVLLYKNVTSTVITRNPTGSGTVTYTLTDQGIGQYDSVAGDSGAPVIANMEGIDKIIGVHVGLGCVFESSDGRCPL